MKIRMDLKTLEYKINELINHSKSRYAKEEGYGIVIGLEILNSYLVSICERAIKIDDAIIMCDLLNIGVLKPDNADEERQIRERAREVEE